MTAPFFWCRKNCSISYRDRFQEIRRCRNHVQNDGFYIKYTNLPIFYISRLDNIGVINCLIVLSEFFRTSLKSFPNIDGKFMRTIT